MWNKRRRRAISPSALFVRVLEIINFFLRRVLGLFTSRRFLVGKLLSRDVVFC